jgi:hypothetical protein
MRIYSTPTIERLASVRELTLGQSTGRYLDDDFPRGTEFGDLTFSN